MPYGRKRLTRRTKSKKTYTRRKYNRKGSSVAYRALRVARAATRRVAGEACKFELTPLDFGYNLYVTGSNPGISGPTLTLTTITSGTPWVMPLNWVYQPISTSSQTVTYPRYLNPDGSWGSFPTSTTNQWQYKNPVYYKMLTGNITPFSGTELQYRLKYLYINAIFNSSTPGRMRFVIVRDKLPTDQGATWFNANDSNRSVFNANNINAQLNPLSNGRFVILYDRTIQINTINPLKPFKYYRKMSNKIRNSTPNITPQDITREVQDSVTYNLFSRNPDLATTPIPVGKNAFYLMIFSDGCTFTYDNSDGSTETNTFKLMSRVSYYNN